MTGTANRRTFDIQVPGDSETLRGDAWVPDEPKAVLAIVHGLGEHRGRYDGMAEKFCGRGIAVYKYDQRGHGESGGVRGHAPSFDTLLDGVDAFLNVVKADHPDLPVMLFGQSMGGLVVIDYLLRRKHSIMSAISSSPFLTLPKDPPAAQITIGKLINVIYPSFTQANQIDVNDLSRDATVGEAYSKDPLVHPRISTRMFFGLMGAAEYALEHAGELKTPLLLMHGSSDRITSVKGSRMFAERAPDLCTFKEFDGAYHELHFEVMADEVHDLIAETVLSAAAVKAG